MTFPIHPQIEVKGGFLSGDRRSGRHGRWSGRYHPVSIDGHWLLDYLNKGDGRSVDLKRFTIGYRDFDTSPPPRAVQALAPGVSASLASRVL